ncbi:MAG: RidA family protein [Eubacteriales bacterium]|nr:RidA family protein [Eubacteriales bacterium]
MQKKQIVSTDSAPAAIGPYSQGVKAGGLIYTSGQIPIDPDTGQVVHGDAAAQARRALQNLAAVLDAAGAGFDCVVKTTVFLADMDDFAAVNEVYTQFFKKGFPARSCIQAAKLPKDVMVEIEAVAIDPKAKGIQTHV